MKKLYRNLSFLIFLLILSLNNILWAEDGGSFSFTIVAPKRVVVGEIFKAKIVAKDQQGRIVTNYDRIGHDVEVNIPRFGKVNSNSIAAMEFKNGVAEVEFVYKNLSKHEYIYELEMLDGSILELTGNHKVKLSDFTYKRVDELDGTEDIISFND